MKTFRKIATNDKNLTLIQQSIEQSLNPIARISILDGALIEDIKVTAAATKFDQPLGRQPVGFMVVDKQGPGDVYRTAWTDTTISLQASQTVNVSLWVF